MSPMPLWQFSRWKDVYTAALFEADRTRISARIAEAEVEIVKRMRELFNPRDNDSTDERDALNYALCMLQTLKNFLPKRTERLAVYR
jgi:hypothetical protein